VEDGVASSATDARLRALEAEVLRLAERGVAGLALHTSGLETVADAVRATGIDLPTGSNAGKTLSEYILELRYCLGVIHALRR